MIKLIFFLYSYVILLVCLSVCILLTSKRLNRLGQNWPQGRLINAQNYKIMSPKKNIYVRWISKIHEKNKSAKYFIFVLSNRKCWKIEQLFRVKIKDGRPDSLVTNCEQCIIYSFHWDFFSVCEWHSFVNSLL